MLLQIPGATEPILVGATLVGAGSVVIWFAKTVLDVRDGVRSIKQAVYGDPDIRVPDGLIATVAAVAGAVDSMATHQDKYDARLKAVENTCVAMHGDVIIRGTEP